MRNNLICFLFFTSILAGCSVSELKQDCMAFDKSFLEICNKNCPPKCAELASTSEAVKAKYQPSEIQAKCTDSCANHCQKQLEKVRPQKCLNGK